MRNAVQNRGIVIPQYANMKMYSNEYQLSVTLHIKGDLLPYLQDTIGVKAKGFSFEGFYYKGKYYATIKRYFSYLYLDNSCTYAAIMLKWLKILIRDAKINQLRVERLKIFNEPTPSLF